MQDPASSPARARETPVEDITEVMTAWADLCEFGLRMALSTEHGTAEEIEAAWRGWAMGLDRENRERDEAWERATRRTQPHA
ncbi:MAG: hypothetical protein HYZ53_27355 [Planctomycetes bacterium]|nr:hypothetical protein [Planctomycetota bacterium]